MNINYRFVARAMIAFLALLALALTALALALPRMFPGPPVGPTPPAPTIVAPAGELPTGFVGLQESARYAGEAYAPVGSGFFFAAPDGTTTAAATAHSLSIGNPERLLERVAFGIAGRDGFLAEFDTLHGQPGRRFLFGTDTTVDYVLLSVRAAVDAAHVLTPDPRGGPQPGERVVLFSGLGDGSGGRRLLRGAIQDAGKRSAWAVMDEVFDPASMSGSPFVSAHTGEVVGMAIAGSVRDDRLYIAMHPIGSLVEKALAAEVFPLLSEYR